MASAAVDEARDVGRTAQTAAQTVARDVRDEVGEMTNELRQQARTMVDETRSQLREKADAQTAGVADGLGRFADELRALASGHPDQAATARRYLDQAGSAVADVAGQLHNKDFDGLVHDVQRFARRRPGAFLAVTAVAGFVVGRLAHAARDDAETSPSPTRSGSVDSGIGPSSPTPDATAPQPASPTGGISGVGATTAAIEAERSAPAGEGS